MGIYLNSKKPGILFRKDVRSPYYIDKTSFIKELIPLLESDLITGFCNPIQRYICVTRPRRFGKTMLANMISSYFGRGKACADLFAGLSVSKEAWFSSCLNNYNVIHISFNDVPRECSSYEQYIRRIEYLLLNDLKKAYPELEPAEDEAVWDALNRIVEMYDDSGFIFILDEWDYIFHRDYITSEDKEKYLGFLSSLLKDQPYVQFAYMTGILPITKYSSGSELNMFFEYTMSGNARFSEYFGFSDQEVDQLYARYLERTADPAFTRDDLREWYDGYLTPSGTAYYNPRSVVGALSDNHIGSYWTNAGPYDEIYSCIRHNIDAVRDDIGLLTAGQSIPASIDEYAANGMELRTRSQIFSAMVIYGFLTYSKGCVRIPNRELLGKFISTMKEEKALGSMNRLALMSEEMMQAMRAGNTRKMSEILTYLHNTESPLIHYGNEEELTMVVTLACLAGRENYHIVREDKGGIGYADFLFYPVLNLSDDCYIMELKVDDTPQAAIRQIMQKGYAQAFLPKAEEKPRYTGHIVAYGIAYRKSGDGSREHLCEREIIR